jgi:hypothetical protein
MPHPTRRVICSRIARPTITAEAGQENAKKLLFHPRLALKLPDSIGFATCMICVICMICNIIVTRARTKMRLAFAASFPEGCGAFSPG